MLSLGAKPSADRQRPKQCKVIEEARAEARVELDAVRVGIEKSIDAAQGELEQMAQTLAVELAQRVLGRPVNAGSALNN